MGHSEVSVTVANYAIFTSEELATLHAKFSPMNQVIYEQLQYERQQRRSG